MLKKSITAQDACNLLNDFLKLDPKSAQALTLHHEKCNQKVANHPTIQVAKHGKSTISQVGLLGIINGMFGVRKDGMGPICCEFNDKSTKITSFKLTPKK
jgi:hypothetical protein